MKKTNTFMSHEIGYGKYLSDIANEMDYPRLSAEEEYELGKKIQNHGDDYIEARNTLITSNLRFLASVARKYAYTGVSVEDINSWGYLGLHHAAEKFNPDAGYRFLTYATYWIKDSIHRGILKETNAIHIPYRETEKIRKIMTAKMELLAENGVEPSPDEIAAYTELSLKAVNSTISKMYKVISLDARVGEDEDTPLSDLITVENTDCAFDDLADAECTAYIYEAIKTLPEREAKILTLNLGLVEDKPMPLSAISKLPEFGISDERVRQLKVNAIKKIKENPKVASYLSGFTS